MDNREVMPTACESRRYAPSPLQPGDPVTRLQMQLCQMHRAARPPKLAERRGEGGEKGLFARLQLQHLQIRTQAKLQRRPPLQIHRKIGLLSGGVRMYCSHLLDAASVLNCRWLYYTQEDANGMYGSRRSFLP